MSYREREKHTKIEDWKDCQLRQGSRSRNWHTALYIIKKTLLTNLNMKRKNK